MQAEAHYNKIKAPFILRHQLYLHIFMKKTIQHNRSSRNNILPERSQCQPCQLKVLDTERNAYNGDAQQ